ncbi:MAG: MFS transporter, partial [Betaproteobacteria bacterium]
MSSVAAQRAQPAKNAQTELDGVYRKIFFRLIPFLMVLWILAWIDRVNIGFV